MILGIIDLGTNTFNLLIAEVKRNEPIACLLNTKTAVMLGREGLDKGLISDAALARAYSVLSNYRELLNKFKCDKEMAFGTSAIRSARNTKQFIDNVTNELNIHIETISGDQEAEYIYYGVKEIVEFTNENYLILDIGGGSNEFIIANKNELLWKQSFPLGGARLIEKFMPGNPISDKEIGLIKEYLNSELTPLKDALLKYPITKLVGASGAFDSFAEILHYEHTGLPLSKQSLTSHISLNEFDSLYQMILNSTNEDRLLIPGIDSYRVETIVMATIFTKVSLSLSGANEIIQCAYSLKEGVAALCSKQ